MLLSKEKKCTESNFLVPKLSKVREKASGDLDKVNQSIVQTKGRLTLSLGLETKRLET